MRAQKAWPGRRWPRRPAARLRARRRFAEAIPEYETALAGNPNWVIALHTLGQCKLYTGSIEETIPLRTASDPAQPSRSRARRLVLADWVCASAFGLNGETERAAAELAEARRLSADDRHSSIARLRALRTFRVCRRSAPSARPPISPGCARPGCRTNNLLRAEDNVIDELT